MPAPQPGVSTAKRGIQWRGTLGNTHLVLLLSSLALLASFALHLTQGAVSISLTDTVAALVQLTPINVPVDVSHSDQVVVTQIRLPRACLGALAGAALAMSGAVLQGMFRNPLADPGLIGVSTGSALAAASMIVFGGSVLTASPSWLMPFVLPSAAFGGGLLTTLLVYRISTSGGHTEVATLLLAGVALNAMAAAGIGLLVFASDDTQLRDLNFWMLGSLARASWDKLLPVTPLLLVPIPLLALFARPLNALLLGEADATHLGYEVERIKRHLVTLAALATGASVALTGVIGFVGLVVPHLIRLLAGPNHVSLLPASALLGASLLLLADLAARTLVLPAELPIGIVTSCIGGPFFVWLLLRRRAQGTSPSC